MLDVLCGGNAAIDYRLFSWNGVHCCLAGFPDICHVVEKIPAGASSENITVRSIKKLPGYGSFFEVSKLGLDHTTHKKNCIGRLMPDHE